MSDKEDWFYKIYKSGRMLVEVIERLEATGELGEAELELGRAFKATHQRLDKTSPQYLERYEREKMDKYELYAVGHYLSCWPENCTFTELMQWLRLNNEDTDQEIWVWEMIEGVPLTDVADMIERMVSSLRSTFQ